MAENNIDNIPVFSGFEDQAQENYAPVTVPGQGMQRVQTDYVTAIAVQKPRSISRITSSVLQEAAYAGANFYYRWSVKDKKGRSTVIQGPSIDLAMCLVRNYGNCVLNTEVEETPTHYLFKGIFIDLETGFTSPRLFRQRKSQTIGKFDRDRQEDIIFQIGQSKALRNAVIRAMPSWLIEQAIAEAYNSELGKIKPDNLATARARCISFFESFGIELNRIEAKIGRKADMWTKEDIVDLRGAGTALKDGHANAWDLFPEIIPEPPPEPPQEKAADESKAKPKTGKETKTNGKAS